MNCPKCGKKTRVVDSRLREGGVWRRRKCAKGHLSHTMQTAEEFIEARKAGRPKLTEKKSPAEPKKTKPKAIKSKPVLYPPAIREWGLVVTKDSPLWLKSIAMRLER